MKLSLNWIKEFVDIPQKYSARELADLLTIRTCEVEGFEDEARKFSGMIVGKVIKMRPHPNANKLRLADTDIGGRTVQIVCGGANLAENMLVPVALPGATVNWHGSGEIVELKETKIRGETSFGMICAGEEISLPKAPHEGITDLSVLWAQWGLKLAKPGTPLAEALGLNDVIFDIDNKSLTHRPDLWGHYGMAREFAAVLGKTLKPLVNKVAPTLHRGVIGLTSLRLGLPPKKGPKINIKFEKTGIASRFLSAVITEIKIEQSPEWMQNRLRAIGMRPINNIVDITNYVMHELGQPLHAFDRRTVENDKFIIRFAREGEILETLDHKKRKLHPEDALVTNGEKALGLAGIMGGANSEVTPRTTEIVLEAACWNPILIRKTAQRHNLRSDAAQRFEKSLDPEYTGFGFHRACELILKLCSGASFAGPATDLYPAKTRVRKLTAVTLDLKRVNEKIGVQIPEKEATQHLKALEFGVKNVGKGHLKVEIPTFRATKDINIEDDLVEEIARMHGYEKIPSILPKLPIRLPVENRERKLKHEARRILSLGLGFRELNLYSFYGAPEIRNCLLPEEAHLKIENPLTEDQTHLRVSLIPNILKAVALNLYSQDEFKLYEIGRTYLKTSAYFPLEEKFICGVIAKKKSAEVFYDALGALRTFLEKLGLAGAFDDTSNPPPYAHPSKTAAFSAAGNPLALIYEIHPQTLKNIGIKGSVAAFEINFTRLAATKLPERAYRPIPRFPGIEIDVSVLVPSQTHVRTIKELIRHSDQNLITNCRLLDIFEDKSLGAEKKSFTFRVLLQSPDRTLTDEEMKTVQERIFIALKKSGLTIRG